MYGFLFAFHRNCGSLLYHFQDSLRDWPKIEIFHIHAFDAPPPLGVPIGVLLCRLVWKN